MGSGITMVMRLFISSRFLEARELEPAVRDGFER
jgi:hypothetical protein